MVRSSYILGNWKMHKTSEEARAFIGALKNDLRRRALLAVPFTALEVASAAAEGSLIAIGAQNMHDAPQGAFTGEVSAPMIKESGATFVILGHSERRLYFGETNPFIRRKIVRALEHGLTPVLCIGESLEERQRGHSELALQTQLRECLEGIDPKSVLIAYEPLWAIGTGTPLMPKEAGQAHKLIRQHLLAGWGTAPLGILYGGSVSLGNAPALLLEPEIDGVLVGGASLDPHTFSQIVNC